jgi:integrase
MSHRKQRETTSYVTGEKGKNRVRVFTDPRTGMIYLEYRDGQGRKARTACGHRDFAGAKAQADDLAAQLRHPNRSQVGAITLAELFDNYLREVTPTKGASKRAHDRRTAALVLDILGPARRAAELTHRDAARFVTERRRRGDGRSGARQGQPLRARALQYDVSYFKAVLAWAVGVGMLDRNPLIGYAPAAEASPRRPIVNASQYEALLAASHEIHSLFWLALIVVHETGHRIGAVRLLRWADVDLERQLVRWRGENDKIGYEHETWLTPGAVEALQNTRRSQAVISEWVFPAPSDPTAPISRHLVRDWWERGQALAKLPPEPGRGWHSLRRQFATEMKHAPLKDLCALGGWKSPQTVLTCYQRADAVSMQQALAARRRLEA